VFHADMDPLLYNPIADLLVDFNADSTGSDVPDDSGPAVVELEGHALVDRSVFYQKKSVNHQFVRPNTGCSVKPAKNAFVVKEEARRGRKDDK